MWNVDKPENAISKISRKVTAVTLCSGRTHGYGLSGALSEMGGTHVERTKNLIC